jgi:hypothetical protein
LDPAGHVQTSATGEDKYVSREIGAANAGMQVKFAAGGDSQIVATGGSGTVLKTPKSSSRCKKPCLPVRAK